MVFPRPASHDALYGTSASPLAGRLAATTGRIEFTCVSDRRFASRCSPPRLSATQFRPATGSNSSNLPTRTCTLLIRYTYKRTGNASPQALRRAARKVACEVRNSPPDPFGERGPHCAAVLRTARPARKVARHSQAPAQPDPFGERVPQCGNASPRRLRRREKCLSKSQAVLAAQTLSEKGFHTGSGQRSPFQPDT